MKKRLSIVLALVLCLSLTVPALAAGPTFPDVSAGHWAYGAVEQMAAQGVVNGMEGGKFLPGDPVTSAQFSTMMARLLFPEELKRHTDTAYWWKPYADTLLEAGALDNTTAKAFYIRAMYSWDKAVMDRPMNRYDMAQIMYNVLKLRGAAMPGAEQLQAARAAIPDFASVPAEYAQAVAAMYAMGCLTGMDAQGSFLGGAEMNRAQACTVLVRLQDRMTAQPETPSAQPTPTPTPEPTPEPTADPLADLDAVRQEMLALINAERAKVGASPLALDAAVCQAAQLRATELVRLYSHTRPDGTECFTAFNGLNISLRRGAGENIAMGYPSVAQVMVGWMNSPGHRQNILDPTYDRIGIGFYRAGSGYYWAQMFVG